jgi:hypothetical protein
LAFISIFSLDLDDGLLNIPIYVRRRVGGRMENATVGPHIPFRRNILISPLSLVDFSQYFWFRRL